MKYSFFTLLFSSIFFFSMPVSANLSQQVEITCSSQIQPQTGKLLMSAKLTLDGKPVLVRGKWEYADQEGRTETAERMTMTVIDQGSQPGRLDTTWKFSGIVYGETFFSEKKCSFERMGLVAETKWEGEELVVDGKISGVDRAQGDWKVELKDANGNELENQSRTSNQKEIQFRFTNLQGKISGTLIFTGIVGEQNRTIQKDFTVEPKSQPPVVKATVQPVSDSKEVTAPKLDSSSFPFGATVFIVCTIAVFTWLQWRKMKGIS